MQEFKSIEKQVAVPEMEQQPLQRDQHFSLSARDAWISQEEMESKQQKERKGTLLRGMELFTNFFQNDWDHPKLIVENTFGERMADFFKGYGITESKYRFSLANFATGTETVRGMTMKRSATALDMMDSLNDMHELTKDGNADIPPDEFVRRLCALSIASKNYTATHNSDFFWTGKGEARALAAKRVSSMTSVALEHLLTEKDKEAIYDNGDADYYMGETDESIEEDLKKAAKAYHNYSVQIARECHGYKPEGMLVKKMRVLLVNERKIKLYRDRHKDPSERDESINELIREYEENLAWKKLYEIAGITVEDETLDTMIEKHLEEEGEIESTEKDKSAVKNKDEGLSKEQLKGIEDIDNWMIRNFENGGILGSVISCLKNEGGEFLNRMFSLTKRERLHIYYLVEKNRRKSADICDVGRSQTYTPDLNEFKDQVLANKAKFWKRLDGGYTYMHKVDESFHVAMEYRKEIKSLSENAQEENVRKQTGEQLQEGPLDKETTRLQTLNELQKTLMLYKEQLDQARKLSKKDRKKIQPTVEETAADCEKLMQKLRALDEDVAREDVHMSKSQNLELEVKDGTSNYKFIGSVPGTLATGANSAVSATQLLGASWKLEGAAWENIKLFNGSFEQSFAGAVELCGAVTSVISMIRTGGSLSDAERAEKSLAVIQNLSNAAQKAFNISEMILGKAQVAVAKDFITPSAALLGAGINAGIAICRAASADRMETHGKKAGEFFQKKREKLEKKGELTKEEKRELKYEKSMKKLQEDLTTREMTRAIYSGMNAAISIVGLAIPGVGVISGIVSLVASIHDGLQVTELRNALFDNYFNMEELTDRVMEERYKKRQYHVYSGANDQREKVKTALRKRVAGQAGFCNMKSAAEFISAKFAKHIRKKLFGEGIDQEERNGYIEFVKALNLRYNEKKQKPDELTLIRKMSAQ